MVLKDFKDQLVQYRLKEYKVYKVCRDYKACKDAVVFKEPKDYKVSKESKGD